MSRRRPRPSRRLPRGLRARILEDTPAGTPPSPRDAKGRVRIRRDAGGFAEVGLGPRLTRAQVFLVDAWFHVRATEVLHLVINLAPVRFLERGALEALQAAVRRISRAGCHVSLAGMPGRLREMMPSSAAGLVPIVEPARSA